MIQVSKGWVRAHKQTLLPETFIEITYEVTDPALQDAATVSANNNAYFSDPSELVLNVDKNIAKLASVEQGLWGLDGTYDYVGGSVGDPGYVSAQDSDINASFSSVIPTITVDFEGSRSTTIPGLTITWSTVYNEWATSFRITAYEDDRVLERQTITDNDSIRSTVLMTLTGYDRIVVEILGWSLPYHRARCEEIFLGVQTVYLKNELMGFEHTQTADLLSASLPKNEITFRLRNEDNRWNPDNPTGIEQFLLERQEIRLRYGMMVGDQIEWIKGGTFWLSEWNTPANGLEASFTARDAFEFMSEVYTGPMSGTLWDIALAAFEQADLPLQDNGSPRYVVSESLKGYTTDFTEAASDYTIAQILQMVAHAGICVLYADRDGVIHVEPWHTGYSGYLIDQHVSYAHPEYNFLKPLKAISVAYGQNQRAVIGVTARGEVQTVSNPLLRIEGDAIRVGRKAKEILESRKTLSGEYRADLRMDALDLISVTSKYATNIVAVTSVRYTTSGGAFRGSYEGRVVSQNLQTDKRYSGEFYVGEI